MQLKKYRIILIMVLSLSSLFAQDKKENNFGISFSGFVRNDMMFDTRQVEALREGAILMYPKNELLDAKGSDINASSSLNFLCINSRLATKITGPDAFGAKTLGYMEGEYFGGADADINGFRLRHAYLRLDWENTSLLIGQYWHPMFNIEMIPSYSFAAPLIPYSRNPQVKLTYSTGDVALSGIFYTQRDFRSYGPNGNSSEYLRNSAIPDIDLMCQWKKGNNTFGANFDYKSLLPRLKGANNLVSDERINSIAVDAFLKLNVDLFTFKLQGVYGQNLADISLIGGYAGQKNDSLKYSNINTWSFWTELSYGKEICFNLFLGYVKNLGADDEITTFYSRASDVDNILKIAPNISVLAGKAKFVGEVEYTNAGYGKPDSKGKVQNIKNINNIRISISTIYYF